MFSQFALHERLLKAVAALNFSEPTPVQVAAIPPALLGRDLRVTARTGSGKTAAFVLPMLHRLMQNQTPRSGIRALILLPTRELAQQTRKQVQVFAAFTFLKGELVTGGEDFKKQAAMLRKCPDVLIATPGRLLEHLETGHLDLSEVEILVLDEADRMLDMGFAEKVQQLVAECSSERQTLLFSATTGGAALRTMVATVLHNPQHIQTNRVSELNEGTRLQIITVDGVPHKEKVTAWLLANEPYQKAIVFTNTRLQADRLGGVLVAANQKAFVLHGDKDQKIRKLAIDRFKRGEIKALVATDVAARGLDVEGLDLVINFDLPHSGDEYVHRVGRTGRAGGVGLAITLIGHNDWNLMSSIERYLKQQFERRVIKELKGSYAGPKKLKASGKAAGKKKKPEDKKTTVKKAKNNKKGAAKATPEKLIAKAPKNAAALRDGSAPLKRRAKQPT